MCVMICVVVLLGVGVVIVVLYSSVMVSIVFGIYCFMLLCFVGL